MAQIIAEVLARVSTLAAGMSNLIAAVKSGTPYEYLTPAEAAQARQGALASRRGRPVSDDTLRRVAEIVTANKSAYGYRERIRDEFPVSTRTASRWVQQAIDRGFLTEEVADSD